MCEAWFEKHEQFIAVQHYHYNVPEVQYDSALGVKRSSYNQKMNSIVASIPQSIVCFLLFIGITVR